jgi:FkbM family methyltransferase
MRFGRPTSNEVSVVEKLALAGLRVASSALQPTHFKGYGRIANILRRVAPQRHVVLELDGDCLFRFPFADAYWSRLSAQSVVYEPEILALFQLLRGESYALIDCGANFGYWSILASGKALGSDRVLAIEASGRNVRELAANASLNGNRFDVLHAAVAQEDGGVVTLGGPTHEGLAIVDAASAGKDAETVACMSLDGIVRRTPWLDRSERFVLKLDVEGVEEAALRGAKDLLERNTLLIYEEQGSDRVHGNTRYVSQTLAMTVFVFRDGKYRKSANPIADVAAMKTNSRRGYNVVATKSDYWLERLTA